MAVDALAAFAVFSGFACAAGWTDSRHRTISNRLCLAMAAAGLAVAAYTLGVPGMLTHLLHLVVALAIGIGIFALGWWGGGDGKLYAATAAWFPLAQFFALVFWISVAGLVLVSVSLATRRWRSRKAKAELSPEAANGVAPAEPATLAGLPYGLAIGAGGVVTLALATF